MTRRLVGSPREAGFVQLHQAVPLVERQHAIIEELRINAPALTSVRRLAERTGVSTRTIERDIDRLRAADVPIVGRRGADGGYRLDCVATPQPVALSHGELASLIAALVALGPYTTATTDSARRKLLGALTASTDSA